MYDFNKDPKNPKGELLDYVTSSLDEDDKEDKTVVQFINRINEPIEYKSLMKNFKWELGCFKEIDKTLTVLGYQGNDIAIKEIHDFLVKEIKEVGIKTFNATTGANIKSGLELAKELFDNNKVDETKKKSTSKPHTELFVPIPPYAYESLNEHAKKINWASLDTSASAINFLKTLQDEEIDWESVDYPGNKNKEKFDYFNAHMLPVSKLVVKRF